MKVSQPYGHLLSFPLILSGSSDSHTLSGFSFGSLDFPPLVPVHFSTSTTLAEHSAISHFPRSHRTANSMFYVHSMFVQ